MSVIRLLISICSWVWEINLDVLKSFEASFAVEKTKYNTDLAIFDVQKGRLL